MSEDRDPPYPQEMRQLWQPDDFRQRPRDYDPALADRIVEQVANGQDLFSLCLSDRDLPLPATFLRWVERDELLRADYEQARRIRTDLLVEDILRVSDSRDSRRSRVQLDARKFHAERLAPEKYGPRPTGPEPDQKSTADAGAELRRRLDDIYSRIGRKSAEYSAEQPATQTSGS